MSETNITIQAFGYPNTLIKEYKHWCVLLRPKQVTLGCLVLAEKSGATNYGDISVEAMTEQKKVVADIEAILKKILEPQKFNYLMLMMVDPNVHFHVIPRYEKEKLFEGITFQDTGWPKLPDMGHSHEVNEEVQQKLIEKLKESWPS